jgi:hypothetical protein
VRDSNNSKAYQANHLNSTSQLEPINSLQNRSMSSMKSRVNRKNSILKGNDDPSSKSSTFGLGLFEQKRLKVMENLKELKSGLQSRRSGAERAIYNSPANVPGGFYEAYNQSEECWRSDEKTGYLLKRALHTRMGKSWLRRKCAAQKGFFCIYHQEEHKDPIKLNLALCEVKVTAFISLYVKYHCLIQLLLFILMQPIGDRRFQVYYPSNLNAIL